MPDIIFHIGLPKCASTNLQNSIFKDFPGFLGTHKELPYQNNFARQFVNLCPAGPRLSGNLRVAKKWKSQVLKHGKSYDPSVSRYIVSSELLSNGNKINSRPIVRFLKKFKSQVWSDGDVKVVLIIRHPAKRLASSYAQVSNYNPYASQKDFERYVEKTLLRQKRYLSGWVEDLFQNIGKENCCILLMEDIDRLEFWENLKYFCSLDGFEPKDMLCNVAGGEASNKYNSNQVGGYNRWNVKHYDSHAKANTQSIKIVGFFWPAGKFTKVREAVRQLIRRVFIFFYSFRFSASSYNDREGFIELTDEIFKKVNELQYEDHKLLSDLLERDLKNLGY